MSLSLYYHPLYSDGLDRTARFPVDRYRLLKEKLCQFDEGKGIKLKPLGWQNFPSFAWYMKKSM
ncbi:MAG: hypothetical protein ACJZ64_00535 [Opitutales bacterium]